ncbi:MAG: MucB/RseB C-terminal domain-containing protein [Proteobacteria bacterium]|nr:MucB/RseB C-terminal domain-containing protein [Pseudomonadota bacterium]
MFKLLLIMVLTYVTTNSSTHAEAKPVELSRQDALIALKQVAYAGRTLDFTGVFVIQKGDHFETCRITHHGSGSKELEKIERLNGDALEIARVDDNILVYLPGKKYVKSKLGVEDRSFPSLTPNQLSMIEENYVVFVGAVDRVAGRFVTRLSLLPRDALRYRHELWIDQNTGLQIKAQMYTERNELVEQIMFTEIAIGSHVTEAMTRSAYEEVALSWRSDRGARKQLRASTTGSLWSVSRPPQGFKQVMKVEKKLGQRGSRVHLVFSDGFVTVSVFIDSSVTSRFSPGFAKEGSLNIYRRVVNDEFVTVLGDVPANTLKQVGDSLVRN